MTLITSLHEYAVFVTFLLVLIIFVVVATCCCYATFKMRKIEKTVKDKVKEFKIKANENMGELKARLEEGLEEERHNIDKVFLLPKFSNL